MEPVSGVDIVVQLVPFMLLIIPFIVFNYKLANKMGKSGAFVAFLTAVPLLGYFISIYMIYAGIMYAIDCAKSRA